MNRCHPILVFFAGTLLLSSGCGHNPGQEDYVPSEEVAQRALETALKAWQIGKLPSCKLPEISPVIQLIDTHQQPVRKLDGFSVLGPTTGDAPCIFAVRLTFDNPKEEVRARYVVFGRDPLWVVRYEDYEMFMHWDCGEETTPAKKPKS